MDVWLPWYPSFLYGTSGPIERLDSMEALVNTESLVPIQPLLLIEPLRSWNVLFTN